MLHVASAGVEVRTTPWAPCEQEAAKHRNENNRQVHAQRAGQDRRVPRRTHGGPAAGEGGLQSLRHGHRGGRGQGGRLHRQPAHACDDWRGCGSTQGRGSTVNWHWGGLCKCGAQGVENLSHLLCVQVLPVLIVPHDLVEALTCVEILVDAYHGSPERRTLLNLANLCVQQRVRLCLFQGHRHKGVNTLVGARDRMPGFLRGRGRCWSRRRPAKSCSTRTHGARNGDPGHDRRRSWRRRLRSRCPCRHGAGSVEPGPVGGRRHEWWGRWRWCWCAQGHRSGNRVLLNAV
mmetsp:Transcript_30774/g.88379  ORF Transcript_30774/g.88379 Transcript_30774/m.88379 type:complete len:289 (+) Transcript_30774:336-1202(+)